MIFPSTGTWLVNGNSLNNNSYTSVQSKFNYTQQIVIWNTTKTGDIVLTYECSQWAMRNRWFELDAYYKGIMIEGANSDALFIDNVQLFEGFRFLWVTNCTYDICKEQWCILTDNMLILTRYERFHTW